MFKQNDEFVSLLQKLMDVFTTGVKTQCCYTPQGSIAVLMSSIVNDMENAEPSFPTAGIYRQDDLLKFKLSIRKEEKVV